MIPYYLLHVPVIACANKVNHLKLQILQENGLYSTLNIMNCVFAMSLYLLQTTSNSQNIFVLLCLLMEFE